MVEFVEQY